MRRKFSSLRRRGPVVEPRPRVLIVCEGEKTEPLYFEALRREEVIRLLDVVVDDTGVVPRTLVDKAVDMKHEAEREAAAQHDDNLRYDEVWCVFDVDDHPKIKEAEDRAKGNGIRLAKSNPCFELWLLLHFQDQNAFIERAEVRRLCRKYIPGYHKVVPYSKVSGLYSDAVKRASLLARRNSRDTESGKNPSTEVFRLTERLHEMSRDEQWRRHSAARRR